MYLIVTVAALAALLFLLASLVPKNPFKPQPKGSCSSKCSSKHIDPVNEPEYNVQEAIKQVLLLEQHLAEKAKYCKSCCTKHFLLIEALLEEGVWMSCKRCAEYPKLEESVEIFKRLFKQWHDNMDDEKIRLEVLASLRDWRREMVDLYYFKDGNSDSHS